jgi:hypothetical protein
VARDLHRYFIELHPALPARVSRGAEREARRRAALDFIAGLQSWLHATGNENKVGHVDVTLFGQVLITCEADVIDRVREQDILNVAAIRQAATLDQLSLARQRLSA